MYPYNRSFVPPRSNADMNQTTNPSQPVSPVPTRPTPYSSDFVEYNQNQTGFMNLLNHPLTGPKFIRLEIESLTWEESGRLKPSGRHYASPTSSRIHKPSCNRSHNR
ncbi:hypothetical protein Hanom_Chr12g01107191 [Helianthus anomalus]